MMLTRNSGYETWQGFSRIAGPLCIALGTLGFASSFRRLHRLAQAIVAAAVLIWVGIWFLPVVLLFAWPLIVAAIIYWLFWPLTGPLLGEPLNPLDLGPEGEDEWRGMKLGPLMRDEQNVGIDPSDVSELFGFEPEEDKIEDEESGENGEAASPEDMRGPPWPAGRDPWGRWRFRGRGRR
jgi:hypothetical protein